MKLKELFKEFLKVRDTKEAIARGAAIGFFWSLSIIWGTQWICAIITAQLLKGNKIIAAIMTAISNPLTSIPLYTFCYIVGNLLLPGPPLGHTLENIHSIGNIINLGTSFFLTMIIGTTIVGSIGAFFVYFIIKIFSKIRLEKKE